MLLETSIIHELPTRSTDFVLAFPQADLDVDVYMEVPFGFEPDDALSNRDYALKPNKIIYRLNQASKN